MVEQQRRQIAYKVRVNDILSGEYIKREGWQPNSVLAGNTEVSRVNLIATVVSQPTQDFNHLTALLDDGTGKISLRSFQAPSPLEAVNIGDVVLVIARPREYNKERYLLPEIIKRIDNPKWIELRQMELQNRVAQVDNRPEAEEPIVSPTLGKIPELIKQYDQGEGADYQKVVERLNSADSEEAIERLLKEGEIFEVRPGKLKMLE